MCALSPQIVDIVSTILIYHSQGQRFGQDSIQDTVSVDMNQTFVGPAEIGDVLVIETFLLRRLVRLPRPLRLGPCTFMAREAGRPGGPGGPSPGGPSPGGPSPGIQITEG